MIKRMIIMLVAVGLVLGGVFGFKAFVAFKTKQFMAAMGVPAQSVSTTKAVMQDWQPELKAVGSLRAVNGADLSSEVSGIVERLSFESGADVEKDAVLVELRAEDDIAKLHALEALAKIADITVQRDQKQIKAQAISQATLDNDLAALESAKAQVVQQQAMVDKKIIKAPFGGHIGVRQVDVGQYLNPGATIVTLQQLNPVYVDFTLPANDLAQMAVGRKVKAHVDAIPDGVFEGEISAINAKVDEATRNIQVRATFKNPDYKMIPGMFAVVNIDAGETQHLITLPQTAVTYNPYGNTVYLVDNTNTDTLTVRQAFITTGATRGDQIAVLSGVKEGDEVVTTGQMKLRNGAPIKINNEIQPLSDASPKVEDK